MPADEPHESNFRQTDDREETAMRRIVLQMMTTLNGRLDDPGAWVHGVSDDQYRDINRIHDAFDTVLVGRTTYEEMAAYWPMALETGEGTESNRRMAQRMHDYRKLVFSRSGAEQLTPWNRAELVVAPGNAQLATYLRNLKAAAGGDIHLSGGASFAQSVAGLGLVDELQLFVYPTISAGAAWFAGLPDGLEMKLLASDTYENGVVRMHYAVGAATKREQPERFTELLAAERDAPPR
jgi:dihydrofolate reductase